MKINSIKNDFTLKSGYLETYNGSQHSKEKSAGLCEKNNRGYNIAFNGGLPVQSGAAVNSLKSKKIKALDWLLKFAKDHNVAGSALMALFLAGALRPATIMALPGKKDKEDKIYASGHSMASGLIGFGVSTLLTTPWDNGVKRVMDNYKNHYETVLDNIKNGTNNEPVKLNYKFNILKNRYDRLVDIAKEQATKATALEKKLLKKQVDDLGLIMKNVTDWVIAIPRAMLTIALIPLILKYVFGLEKKKPVQEVQNKPEGIQDNVKEAVKSAAVFAQKSLSQFAGGNK